ncbi:MULTISPECIES: Asp-tRNA(Asn)/Glu-tRNA(Gln) amidotransferase subunit GatC [unclassified Oleiphilus]|jgi:aspartyl-tRNA(Asn)/glutamyl-tRNA(Gln) amidotransferase subunit C|uniref:Asp-tRNA(Asn)/Glu-tRNA(Gln) amidotransferase subunit GatC n=2 Tax=Oleiphilus TaxID=141450 RepID=UPI0007C3B6AE|nr:MULTISPECIES: Asp-tRNA(Asn)/Glu-tRNA(Gln) amidotransferase subunit GatC [unclassified Oleiphilus]KZY43707.1 asparaginyl/glutamyl-tRNA amidotransferase subunit C [Oleiphilus sp. HI0050]KZY78168.1 asparaginyl/glutamyl-tRNA amidotransferase subunit C [Oleiphilus sp. HI0069]KZY78308.1 asparaginyl/glutamyl-tRNA amidotransferase subunit C [Oleiphilus sp. HI0068]KZY96935.1 asparaginyl/glutamyl-tRNA amidotransferase subunit C [Oleiphilus sp. HI0072]KZZ13949.1 asparaginyl/glutamyl-tRNA amidotransfer
MSIDPEDINKIAHLARLHIEDDKVEKISNDITNILSLVDQLQNANTEDIPPMAHPMDAVQVLRPDVVTESDKREKLQTVAPNTEDGLFLVPKVIE